jgi:Flp pilus assembly pilin Flp
MFVLVQFASIAGAALRRRGLGDRGASVIEYALLLTLIAIACFAAMELFGSENSKSIDNSAGSIATS